MFALKSRRFLVRKFACLGQGWAAALPVLLLLLLLWLIEKWTSLSTQSNYADKQPLKILTTNCFNAAQKPKKKKKERGKQNQ